MPEDAAAHGQHADAVRLEHGPVGGAAVATGADLAVVVDVLSFTTTVSVALTRGVDVLPFAWRDERAAAHAAAHDAALAVGRLEARADGAPRGAVSLSPAHLASLPDAELPARVVLPSPNGATLCTVLADGAAQVLTCCLRDRAAVAAHLAPLLRDGATLAVVAAGERWPDGSLRPAVEDLWGAGALLAALADLGVGGLSPEAEVARAAFGAVAGDLRGRLHACASGAELARAGFAADVDAAAALDTADLVPRLRDGVLAPVGRRHQG